MGELADAAHGFHEAGDAPVADADGDADGDAAEGSAGADEEGEGDGEKHTDGGNHRVGDFDVPLDGEVGDVEAGAAQSFYIAVQFRPIHLKCLADFAIEIFRGLGEFGESLHVELIEAGDGAAGKIANPARFKQPDFLRSGPVRAGGENTAADVERGGIDFHDAEAAEEILQRAEQIVIIDFGIFAEDPALRMGVGLRRAALDLVAQGVLALVGVGEIGFVDEKHGGGEDHSGHEERDDQAMQTDAAGFDGHDFVVLAHDAEGDEDGDERAERGEVVDEIGREVAEIIDDGEEGDAMAGDVVEQLEEGEGFEEKNEDAHDEQEIHGEAAKDVDVQEAREAAVVGGVG